MHPSFSTHLLYGAFGLLDPSSVPQTALTPDGKVNCPLTYVAYVSDVVFPPHLNEWWECACRTPQNSETIVMFSVDVGYAAVEDIGVTAGGR